MAPPREACGAHCSTDCPKAGADSPIKQAKQARDVLCSIVLLLRCAARLGARRRFAPWLTYSAIIVPVVGLWLHTRGKLRPGRMRHDAPRAQRTAAALESKLMALARFDRRSAGDGNWYRLFAANVTVDQPAKR